MNLKEVKAERIPFAQEDVAALSPYSWRWAEAPALFIIACAFCGLAVFLMLAALQ